MLHKTCVFVWHLSSIWCSSAGLEYIIYNCECGYFWECFPGVLRLYLILQVHIFQVLLICQFKQFLIFCYRSYNTRCDILRHCLSFCLQSPLFQRYLAFWVLPSFQPHHWNRRGLVAVWYVSTLYRIRLLSIGSFPWLLCRYWTRQLPHQYKRGNIFDIFFCWYNLYFLFFFSTTIPLKKSVYWPFSSTPHW